MTARQIIAAGIVLGIVAAAVVWYLERFESRRLFREMRTYMEQHDAFQEWLKGQKREGT